MKGIIYCPRCWVRFDVVPESIVHHCGTITHVIDLDGALEKRLLHVWVRRLTDEGFDYDGAIYKMRKTDSPAMWAAGMLGQFVLDEGRKMLEAESPDAP